jgi:hypothetical protein
MHQQGPGGGRALLTAPPEVGAVAVLTPVYGNPKIAEDAIVRNGGTPDMTAGQVRRHVAPALGQRRRAGAGGRGGFGQGGGAGGALPGGAKVLFTGAAKGAGEDDINDSAIKLQASKYLQTGVVPPFGMGRAGTTARNKFYNEAAKQADELHLSSADLVSGAYTTKALGASMTQMQKSLEATQSYEKTALANGELMLSLAPKGGGQTGIPVLNRWLQAGRKQIAGDPDVTKFDNAIGAFSEEYAKVMTGNLGNVAATDGARKDASERLAKYAAQDQLTQGYDVMKQEMENRNHAQEAQVAGIQAKLRAGITPGSPQDTPGAGPTAAPEGQSASLLDGAAAGRREEGRPERDPRFAGQPVRAHDRGAIQEAAQGRALHLHRRPGDGEGRLDGLGNRSGRHHGVRRRLGQGSGREEAERLDGRCAVLCLRPGRIGPRLHRHRRKALRRPGEHHGRPERRHLGHDDRPQADLGAPAATLSGRYVGAAGSRLPAADDCGRVRPHGRPDDGGRRSARLAGRTGRQRGHPDPDDGRRGPTGARGRRRAER